MGSFLVSLGKITAMLIQSVVQFLVVRNNTFSNLGNLGWNVDRVLNMPAI